LAKKVRRKDVNETQPGQVQANGNATGRRLLHGLLQLLKPSVQEFTFQQ